MDINHKDTQTIAVDNGTTEAILKIAHLKKRYDSLTVLDDFNLKVTKGEVIVIVGPSGCGKSTLLRCINGLEEIQAGEVILHGKVISKPGQKPAKSPPEIGMVFQSYELFPHLNVLENIILAPMKVQNKNRKEATEEAMELLDRVGLKDRATSLPRQLSGGQKQRVAIVRALAMHPEILLFDEVTAALDPEMVREVLEVILGLARQGRTMLIVTHEMQFARAIADRVILLEDGNIMEEAPPELFFTNPKTDRSKAFLNTFIFERKNKD